MSADASVSDEHNVSNFSLGIYLQDHEAPKPRETPSGDNEM